MPPAQRDAFTAEMQAAGIDWRLVVYGGALPAFHHTPTGPDGAPSASGEYEQPVVPGVGYHPQHAQRAWNDVIALLAESLGRTRSRSRLWASVLRRVTPWPFEWARPRNPTPASGPPRT